MKKAAACSRENGWEVVWFGIGSAIATGLFDQPISLAVIGFIIGGLPGVWLQRFRPKPPTLSLVRQVRF